MTATPTIVLIPKSGEEGTEIICTGSEDLSVLNSCLSGASSNIDPIQFFCENADYSPIQTVQNNVTIYSCCEYTIHSQIMTQMLLSYFLN